MPSLKDIRNRIQSTKNTQAITRAMKMVSAAKLRRAQNNITNLRPYAQKLLSVIANIAVTQRVEHPLLSSNANPKKVLVVVLTSDRGLAGGFNNNINRFAYEFQKKNQTKYDKMDFLLVGRKAQDFFKARNIQPKDTILNLAKEISYNLANKVASQVIESFKEGEYDAVFMIYNQFKSAIQQDVTLEQLLPVSIEKANLGAGELNPSKFSTDFIFEPAPELIIEDLLKRHFAVQVYRSMSESVAAEHGARMMAMENATKNAGEMIKKMTLTYNKLRQASITTELIEITSGAEALNG